MKNSIRVILFVVTLSFLFSCKQTVPEKVAKSLCDSFTKKELNYYAEIGFGAESDRRKNGWNSRWYKDVKVKTFGTPPYPSDIVTLKTAISKLNEVIEPINITLTKGDDYNVAFHFVSIFDAEKIFKGYTSHFNSTAQFIVHSANGKINEAKIVLYNETTERVRDKVIWEEFTQILGLMQDSGKYPFSVFSKSNDKLKNRYYYKEPLPIDYQLVRILYNYGLPTSLRKNEFLKTIELCN